jgi:hypothetical protein
VSDVKSPVSADYEAGFEVGLRTGRKQGRAQGFKDAMRAMTRLSTAAYDRDLLVLAKTWFELKAEALADEDESLEPSPLWSST